MDQAGETSRPLYLEELEVGQRFTSGAYRMDRDRMTVFAAEFAPQPFHLDPAAVQASVFTGEIPLATGVIGLGGDIAWPRPTRADDTLHAAGAVAIKRTLVLGAGGPRREGFLVA